MYLLPQLQGRGWGWQLLQRAIDSAKNSNFEGIALEMNGTFKAAERLYQAVGFCPYRPIHPLKFGSDRAYYLNLTTQPKQFYMNEG